MFACAKTMPILGQNLRYVTTYIELSIYYIASYYVLNNRSDWEQLRSQFTGVRTRGAGGGGASAPLVNQ
jgi:hypothetical protein